jgi:hypothetical protein
VEQAALVRSSQHRPFGYAQGRLLQAGAANNLK